MFIENNLAAHATQFAMGTVMTHKVFGENARASLSAVCSEIARMEELLSRFRSNSDVSRVNDSAGFQSEKVNPETFTVLSTAVEFSQSGMGGFDVTINPLVEVWRAARESSALPDEYAIQQALPLVNYRDVILDEWALTAGLRCLGQSIDLGGIGKGCTADRILEIYKDFGVESAYSNLGGNVVTLGPKPDGSAWRVGIQHPRRENCLIGLVNSVNQTVVTSGDYQRYFTDGYGNRHHHILNPATGYPAESGLVSVTIVSDNSLYADALSTLLFVAGMEKGLEILKRYPGSEAIFIDTDLQVFLTPGLINHFRADQGMKVTCVN